MNNIWWWYSAQGNPTIKRIWVHGTWKNIHCISSNKKRDIEVCFNSDKMALLNLKAVDNLAQIANYLENTYIHKTWYRLTRWHTVNMVDNN